MQAVGEGTSVDEAGRHGVDGEGVNVGRQCSHLHPRLPGVLPAEDEPRQASVDHVRNGKGEGQGLDVGVCKVCGPNAGLSGVTYVRAV
jgi:hypothetical protein